MVLWRHFGLKNSPSMNDLVLLAYTGRLFGRDCRLLHWKYSRRPILAKVKKGNKTHLVTVEISNNEIRCLGISWIHCHSGKESGSQGLYDQPAAFHGIKAKDKDSEERGTQEMLLSVSSSRGHCWRTDSVKSRSEHGNDGKRTYCEH